MGCLIAVVLALGMIELSEDRIYEEKEPRLWVLLVLGKGVVELREVFFEIPLRLFPALHELPVVLNQRGSSSSTRRLTQQTVQHRRQANASFGELFVNNVLVELIVGVAEVEAVLDLIPILIHV